MSEILDLYASAPKAEELLKAYDDGTIKNVKLNEPKSAIIDPYSATIGGLRQKPSPLPFATLRRMAQVPAIAAVINTRLNQVARFARRPRFEGDMGFKIVLKDKDTKMTEAQKKRAFEIEEFFLKTGTIRNAKRKDNFDAFLRKVVRDTLTLDAMTWEHVANLKGELAELWAVDAATIELVAHAPVGEDNRIAVYEPMTRRGMEDSGHIAYVQKVDGQTIAEFTEAELCYAIRNPRTDIHLVDFGLSELETLVEIVTGIMNGVRYNTSYFSESHLPQGVLEIVGKYKDEHLDAFKRHWRTLTSGASGKWAVPVMGLQEGQGFKFTPFKNNNRDMEFNEFLEFLFNLTCAVYQIDPNEVGFKSWTSNSGAMGRSDNTEVKIDQSKDKGFIPLMQFLSNTFNSEVIDQIDEDYAFQWIGIDEEDEAQKLERDKAVIEMGKMTIAELRKRDDLPEILGEDGKPAKWTLAPANPTLIQVYIADIQAEQQQQQMAMQGEQQNASADAQHKRQLEVMDKQHEHAMQQQKHQQLHDAINSEADHSRQNEVMDKQHEQGKDMADHQFKQNMEMADHQFKQNMEMADHTHEQSEKDGAVAHRRGLQTKQIDQEHAIRMEKEKQRSKGDKPLRKSIDTSEELEITMTWDEY